MLMTTATSLLGDHEASFWSDGTLELEEIASQTPERVILDEIEQYRLYLLLQAKLCYTGDRHLVGEL